MPAPAVAAPWLGPMVTLLLGGGAGIPFDELGEQDPETSPAIAYLRPRVQFTWEKPPLEYGEAGTTVKRTSLVPELEIGALVNGEGFDVYVGGGAKLQLDMAQYRMGWLGLSMKASGFLAARGGVLAEKSFAPFGELAAGEHWWWYSRRFTFEASVGVLDRSGDNDAELTAMLSLGCGWAP